MRGIHVAYGVDNGYVYVLRLSSGVVKVGKTNNFGIRLKAHTSSTATYGVTVDEYWVSPYHSGTDTNEKRLIEYCKLNGAPTNGSGEWIIGVEYADVVRFAEGLTYPSPIPEPERLPERLDEKVLSKMSMEERVKYIVDQAPEFSSEQVRIIRSVFANTPTGRGEKKHQHVPANPPKESS
jgi:hypothetical protein